MRRARAAGRVLPVLDGLDELAALWQARTVDDLERWAAAGRPFLLTCRSIDYERMVADSGTTLSRAAVVEIRPIDAAQAAAFLSEPASGRTRWQPVLQHLRDCPTGVLAQVLSTPLMVTLARTAYLRAGTDPAVLLRLRSREQITRTLVDAFLASVYPRTQPDHRPAREVRWLGCLAFKLSQLGTQDWRWWWLTPETPAPRPTEEDMTLWAVAWTFGTAVVLGLVGFQKSDLQS